MHHAIRALPKCTLKSAPAKMETSLVGSTLQERPTCEGESGPPSALCSPKCSAGILFGVTQSPLYRWTTKENRSNCCLPTSSLGAHRKK